MMRITLHTKNEWVMGSIRDEIIVNGWKGKATLRHMAGKTFFNFMGTSIKMLGLFTPLNSGCVSTLTDSLWQKLCSEQFVGVALR